MRAIITVVESRSMPGRYNVSCRLDSRNTYCADVREAGAAAAQALEYSMRCREGFAIVGPQAVMTHIPADMRSGGAE